MREARAARRRGPLGMPDGSVRFDLRQAPPVTGLPSLNRERNEDGAAIGSGSGQARRPSGRLSMKTPPPPWRPPPVFVAAPPALFGPSPRRSAASLKMHAA